jgi:hypothetical protein
MSGPDSQQCFRLFDIRREKIRRNVFTAERLENHVPGACGVIAPALVGLVQFGHPRHVGHLVVEKKTPGQALAVFHTVSPLIRSVHGIAHAPAQ